MQSFRGKAVVITGGTQGVGLATARLLVQRGASSVTICGRNTVNGKAAEEELRGLGASALFVQADLSRPDDCFKVIDQSEAAFGRLDTLINCCGATTRGTLESTTPDLWDYLFAVNVRAPFLLIQRSVPIMRRGGRGGAIANIGSIAAYGGQPYITAYCAAKAALLILTKNLANSLRWDRIRVNALNIGWTATPTEHELQANFHGLGEDWLERVSAAQPFGRLLSPEDVAKALAFLASDESGLMTGSIVDFDQRVIGATDDNPIGADRPEHGNDVASAHVA
ncbi:SDR family oxidoreductase [Mesorhizobium sp. NZP2298]|uniref:SDR family oxidoreductase n=1 Tax=Mesorhizobium sp. NZP2298 TaxID=2483403 RepID=UPI00155405D4|nr:SDR family oxidoreductase [Mesorhizobium sp. NZP2298]QKC93767.1 SDR family oxidoreductase [Mesorhizobium sp. NZP2298]